VPAPTERHSRAAIEIRRFFEPDISRQVEALLAVLDRPSPAAAEHVASQIVGVSTELTDEQTDTY
jgi:hypothetical protein